MFHTVFTPSTPLFLPLGLLPAPRYSPTRILQPSPGVDNLPISVDNSGRLWIFPETLPNFLQGTSPVDAPSQSSPRLSLHLYPQYLGILPELFPPTDIPGTPEFPNVWGLSIYPVQLSTNAQPLRRRIIHMRRGFGA